MNFHFIFQAILLATIPLCGFLAPQALPLPVILLVFSQFHNFQKFFRYKEENVHLIPTLVIATLLVFMPKTMEFGWSAFFKLAGLSGLAFMALMPQQEKITPALKKILLGSWVFLHIVILIEVAFGQFLFKVFSKSHGKMYIQGGLLIALLVWSMIGILSDVTKTKKYTIPFFTMSFVTVFFMHSDTAPLALILSLILASISYILSQRENIENVIAYGFASLSGAFTLCTPFIFAWMFKSEAIYRSLQTLTDTSYLHRLAIWREITQKIFENPLLGHGLNSYRNLPHEIIQIPSKYNPGMFIPAEKFGIHPHNLPLHIAYEHGFVGLFLIAVLIATTAFYCIKETDPFIRFAKLGCFFTAMFIFWVNVGAYQSWWISAIILSIILFTQHEKLKDLRA